jgi:hypothetical protein
MLIGFALCLPNVALADAPMNFTVGTAEGKPGEQATVLVSVSNNPGHSAAILTVSYDTSALTLTSISPRGVLSGKLFICDVSINNNFAVMDVSPNGVAGNGEYVALVFTINSSASPGQKYIDLSVKDDASKNCVDTSINPLSVDFSSGYVNVLAPSGSDTGNDQGNNNDNNQGNNGNSQGNNNGNNQSNNNSQGNNNSNSQGNNSNSQGNSTRSNQNNTNTNNDSNASASSNPTTNSTHRESDSMNSSGNQTPLTSGTDNQPDQTIQKATVLPAVQTGLPWWGWALILFGSTAVIFFIFFVWRRRRADEEVSVNEVQAR